MMRPQNDCSVIIENGDIKIMMDSCTEFLEALSNAEDTLKKSTCKSIANRICAKVLLAAWKLSDRKIDLVINSWNLQMCKDTVDGHTKFEYSDDVKNLKAELPDIEYTIVDKDTFHRKYEVATISNLKSKLSDVIQKSKGYANEICSIKLEMLKSGPEPDQNRSPPREIHEDFSPKSYYPSRFFIKSRGLFQPIGKAVNEPVTDKVKNELKDKVNIFKQPWLLHFNELLEKMNSYEVPLVQGNPLGK